jgi:predicted secreted protein
MFLFIIYSVILLIIIHFMLYYFNIDYLNILKREKLTSNMLDKENTNEVIQKLEESLEQSLNELKQTSSI